MGFPAACTLRSNRLEHCPLKSERELRQEGRGAVDYRLSADGILVIKWFDNKEVTMGSNFFSVEPFTEVRRWDKGKKQYVVILRPSLVGSYNDGMGGVDAADQKMAFYRIATKSVKWYKRVFYHFTDLSLVNAYLLFKAMTGNQSLPLYRFKLDVSLALMYAENLANPLTAAAVLLRRDVEEADNGDPIAGADPIDAVRLDGTNHWPQNVAKQQRRCRLSGCKQRSVVWCTKCHVYLCMTKERECFIRYHTV